MRRATPHRSTRLVLRRLTTLAVAAALIGSAPITAATADASTAPATHLAITADPLTVHVGSPIVVSGTATPRVTGESVYLQRYVAGRWRNLTHQATGTTGRYAFSIKAPGKHTTWILRVVRGGTGHARAGASHTVHVLISTSRFHVKASTTANVTAGNPLVVTGSVSPRSTGSVRLQILRGKAWADLATARLTKTSTYSISASRPAGAYRLRVLKPFSATIATGISATQDVAVLAGRPTAPPTTTPQLTISSPDDPLLGLSATRLVFSAVLGQPLPPAQSFTFSNSGTADATVSGLAVTGTDASSFGLGAGAPTSITVPAGGSTTVSIAYHPTPPTNCPVGSDITLSPANRNATLTFTTSDPAMTTEAANLAGIISCGLGGNGEPVLSQVMGALGYSDVINLAGTDPRFLGPTFLSGTDEVASPYFTAANPALPVSVVALAHYSSGSLTPYHTTGWYAENSAMAADGTCSTNCHQLWQFPADPSLTTYNQNQKLLPSVTAGTTFSPTGAFGLFVGDGTGVGFSDDALNDARNNDGTIASPVTHLHDMRIYPAYGPGHVVIPDTYLVGVDVGSVSESKNNDFQDVVLIVRNVVPAG